MTGEGPAQNRGWPVGKKNGPCHLLAFLKGVEPEILPLESNSLCFSCSITKPFFFFFWFSYVIVLGLEMSVVADKSSENDCAEEDVL